MLSDCALQRHAWRWNTGFNLVPSPTIYWLWFECTGRLVWNETRSCWKSIVGGCGCASLFCIVNIWSWIFIDASVKKNVDTIQGCRLTVWAHRIEIGFHIYYCTIGKRASIISIYPLNDIVFVKTTEMPFRRKLNRVSATFLALIIVATAYMCAAYSWIPGDVKSYADKPSTVENLDTFDFTLPHQKQGRKRVCLSFREEANATLTKNRTVSMTNFIGRLGNRISAVSKMVAFAESAGCDVALPRDLLDGWKSSHREWICSGPEVRKRSDSYEFCPERGGKEWFRTESFSAPVCHLKLLQAYFGINSTHVFDRQCLTQNHVALHIRSENYRPQEI